MELFGMYLDYIKSYYLSFHNLYRKDENDKLNCFYTACFIFSNYMELWIKHCILDFDGYLENYSIESLELGEHNFFKLYKDQQTKQEFLMRGITEYEYNFILERTENIKNKVGIEQFSFAFRYPCDKKNNIYLKKLFPKDKLLLLDLMRELVDYCYDIFVKYLDGTRLALSNEIKVLKEKAKFYNNTK